MFTRKPKSVAKLESQDSVVLLDGRNGSTTTTPRATSPLSDFEKQQLHSPSPKSHVTTPVSPCGFPSPTPLAVALTIRRGRALLLTVVAVGVIVGLVFALKDGVEISRFKSTDKNSTMRDKLLDDYNSYSGNVASAFGKPIEMLVSALVQIIALRFLAQAFTQSTTNWRLAPMTLLAGAAVGYLISNAFNALNVQLRPQPINAVIAPTDLSLTTQLSQPIAARTTTVTSTVSELSAGNLITNTVLRNAVLPRVTFKQDLCDWEQTRFETAVAQKPLPTIDYGFTQRDWQSRVLQEALTPQTLQMVVNPTDKTANTNVKAANLPMNATLAADLFLYAMYVSPKLLPWGDNEGFVNTADVKTRYPESLPREEKTKRAVEVTARIVGLLPPSSSPSALDETTQREWLLRELPAAVTRQFNNSRNTSRRDIVLTFSHVDISPQMTFDALSFEVELNPTLLETLRSRDNVTRYTRVSQAALPGIPQDCGPWPALCLVKKVQYMPPKGTDLMDALQQVHAFGTCLSPTSGEQLQSTSFGSVNANCSRASNSSMMIYSVGKRLVADEITQKIPANVNAAGPGTPALMANLRKVYTFTIGRLSWRLDDLSTTFHAKCGPGVATCLGLQLPLASKSLSADGSLAQRTTEAATSTTATQRLVASVDALPTGLLVPSTLMFTYRPRSVPLVEVSEPLDTSVIAGDVLLPHNSAKVTWENRTVTKACDADMEALLFTKINNHMYIEHGLQTAYTAATFFLLQNGVVKDTVQLSADKTTLQFDGNTQDVVVWMSTPQQNAYLTLAGCMLLVVGLLGAILKAMWSTAKHTGDPLAKITAPQAIARVMLDDQQFPPMLLHRRVVDTSKTNVQYRVLDQFEITEVTVQHTEKQDRLTAME